MCLQSFNRGQRQVSTTKYLTTLRPSICGHSLRLETFDGRHLCGRCPKKDDQWWITVGSLSRSCSRSQENPVNWRKPVSSVPVYWTSCLVLPFPSGSLCFVSHPVLISSTIWLRGCGHHVHLTVVHPPSCHFTPTLLSPFPTFPTISMLSVPKPLTGNRRWNVGVKARDDRRVLECRTEGRPIQSVLNLMTYRPSLDNTDTLFQHPRKDGNPSFYYIEDRTFNENFEVRHCVTGNGQTGILMSTLTRTVLRTQSPWIPYKCQ